jgi:transcriptional regulator with XRE-family HTH domain
MRVPGTPVDLERGRRVRRLREAEGLTRKSLAELVGVSPRAVYAWEKEGTPITTPNLRVLAAELRTTPEFILHGTVVKVEVQPRPRRPQDPRVDGRLTTIEGRLSGLEAQLAGLTRGVETLLRTLEDQDRSPAERAARRQRRSAKQDEPPTGATPNRPAGG